MYVAINDLKNNKSVYIMQSYRKENGKTSSRVYRKLGRLDELLERFSGSHEDMMTWAKLEAEKETYAYNSKTEAVSFSLCQNSRIPKDEERSFFVGYLFLQFLLVSPKYSLQNLYRALSVMAEESGFIQEELYRNSNFVHPSNKTEKNKK